METRSVSEWMYLVPHLRFGLPNQQARCPAGKESLYPIGENIVSSDHYGGNRLVRALDQKLGML